MTPARLIPLLLLVLVHSLRAADHVALLGTYTTGESRGIYAVRLDGQTGELSQPELVAELAHPEFLALHPNGQVVYALTQRTGADGNAEGAVATFALHRDPVHLNPIATASTAAGSLCHLAVDASGQLVMVASYGGGYVASFPTDAEGRLEPMATKLDHTGPLGPNEARQNGPHPHSVTLSPDQPFAWVADLGLDRVLAYRLSPDAGTFVAHEPAFATVPAGGGPRHTKFSPDGTFFYILNELTGTVTSCRYDADAAVMTPFETVSLMPSDYQGKNQASEIRIHPSGRFVYAADRGPNTLTVFRRDVATGALTRIETVPTGGVQPRNFSLTPDGRWLLCANQQSNTLTVFGVNAETGQLTSVGQSVSAPRVVCVLFLP